MENSARFRLGKMLGLLGSDQDGEVLAAARAIRRLLAAEGMTFADLVNMVHAPRPSTPPEAARGDPGLVQMAESILRNGALMQPHELKFVMDVRKRSKVAHYYMTAKQSNWFAYLYTRYGEV